MAYQSPISRSLDAARIYDVRFSFIGIALSLLVTTPNYRENQDRVMVGTSIILTGIVSLLHIPSPLRSLAIITAIQIFEAAARNSWVELFLDHSLRFLSLYVYPVSCPCFFFARNLSRILYLPEFNSRYYLAFFVYSVEYFVDPIDSQNFAISPHSKRL